jgi:hypothetical protein
MATLGPVLGDQFYTGSIALSFLCIHSIISTCFLTIRKFLSPRSPLSDGFRSQRSVLGSLICPTVSDKLVNALMA